MNQFHSSFGFVSSNKGGGSVPDAFHCLQAHSDDWRLFQVLLWIVVWDTGRQFHSLDKQSTGASHQLAIPGQNTGATSLGLSMYWLAWLK